MSKSFEEMNLKEFIEYFEEISGIVGVDLDDDNLVTRTLHFLKEYEGVAAVKTYTQEELNEAISKALNDMNTVLSTKDKKIELYKEALKEACEDRRKSICDRCEAREGCSDCWNMTRVHEFRYLTSVRTLREEQANGI